MEKIFCLLCGYEIQSKDELNSFIYEKDNYKITSFLCPKCGKVLPGEDEVREVI